MLEINMKIDGQHPKLPVQDKSNLNEAKKETARSERKTISELSKTSTKKFSVSRIRDRIEAEPDINLEKVKALKAQIKKGEYQVDSKKLANNLIKNSFLEDQ